MPNPRSDRWIEAKTTSAKRIAALLGWPIITLAQGAFLRQGYGNIEAEAERIFHLLSYAKDKVVLFDEFEEMILDRGDPSGEKTSRFLTTSMLPRLHRIRDDAAVVFVIATNHVEVLDPAAYRLGRVDLVMEVGFPDKATRQKMYEALAKAMDLSDEARTSLQRIGFPVEIEGSVSEDGDALSDGAEVLRDIELDRFGYGEIKQVVKMVRLRELQGRPVSERFVSTTILSVSKHSHKEGKS